MLTLIRKAGLAVALAGALATLAVAPSMAEGTRPSSPSATQVIISDVRVPVPGQHPVQAYLVRSAGSLRPHSHAGILFLHWLGQIHSDRTEFLAEATQLAPRGAVSLLPQGVFPYSANPVGTRADVTAIRKQLAVFRAALNWLIARRYVDRSRIAVVGHDYGAMYGALLANSDPRVHAAVLATPDATWGHWFVKYWLGFTGKRAARYDALFTSLQPVRHVSRLGNRELFQWAGQDIFVSASVRKQFARSAPQARVDLYPASDHQLTDVALADRDAFLARELGLSR
ncbi:MAG TPA: dienelactone hydrolase family protein [Streptosporangiaceae bacterium]|nr:dienelactone hydrolase family protein [Streptosporangiaceae bacterium]